MGRPHHDIWTLFKVEIPRSEGKPHPDVRCQHCDALVMNAQPSRNLLQHALKCTFVPEKSKARWKLLDAQQRQAKQEKLRTPRKARSPSGSTPSLNKRYAPKRTKQDNFMRVATGFYATGIAFRIVEDPKFRAMFDYELPSRRQLAEKLLDNVYKREKDRVIERLSTSTHLALVTDGWSNTNNDSIINFMLANPRVRPVFWKSVNTNDAAHTAAYIAQSISNAIGEIEAEIGEGAVTAVVTDNAANMKAAWKILESRHSGLVCTGCTAHGVNLLMKDVFELRVFADVLKKATVLSRFVKARHAMWDRFRDLQKKVKKNKSRHRLSLPVPTRWYTQEKCVRSVFENKDIIFAVFSDVQLLERFGREANKLEEVVQVVRDEAFWQEAEMVLKLAEPINFCLAAFERDNCSISLVYHQFEWLLEHNVYTRVAHCDVNLQRMVLELIEERGRRVCNDTIANFLDQTKSTYGFIEGDIINIIDRACAMAQRLGLLAGISAMEFHRQLVAFGIAKRKWSSEDRQMHAKYNPLDWWTLTNRYPIVKQFAARILSIPTSSASSERSWSIHGFIHSKNRNRLSVDRVNKLVFVYTNIAEHGAADHILYELFPDAYDDEKSNGSDSEESDSEDCVSTSAL